MYKANNKASIKLFSSFSVILSFDENYFHKIFIAVYTAVFRFMGGLGKFCIVILTKSAHVPSSRI